MITIIIMSAAACGCTIHRPDIWPQFSLRFPFPANIILIITIIIFLRINIVIIIISRTSNAVIINTLICGTLKSRSDIRRKQDMAWALQMAFSNCMNINTNVFTIANSSVTMTPMFNCWGSCGSQLHWLLFDALDVRPKLSTHCSFITYCWPMSKLVSHKLYWFRCTLIVYHPKACVQCGQCQLSWDFLCWAVFTK